MSFEKQSRDQVVPGRCCVFVRVRGLTFPHYHQCRRVAVATGPIDLGGKLGPTCRQHSEAAVAAAKEKTQKTDERRRNLYFARLRARRHV